MEQGWGGAGELKVLPWALVTCISASTRVPMEVLAFSGVINHDSSHLAPSGLGKIKIKSNKRNK